MNVTVRFDALYEWAIPPEKVKLPRSAERETGELYQRNFRYQRHVRRAGACPPWVLGQELGWIVRCPIDVTLTPVDDVQFGTTDNDASNGDSNGDPGTGEADLAAVGRMLNRPEVWRRGQGWLATPRTDWLRFHQFKNQRGAWEGMFVPNGEGSVEWRLGWSASIPADMFLLITGLDTPCGLEIPTGVLPARHVNATADGPGMSLAVRPHQATRLTRGAPLARIVLLHRASLQATTHEVA
ncbi:hypothetical protein ABZ897_62145 [Nonomuraea sp. NPDC046802]|uniref:hypothetical protein n=1 Tax=Nonomuraea sp. NPDC046802 TaxID=3154919 RepID=UPI0033E8650E